MIGSRSYEDTWMTRYRCYVCIGHFENENDDENENDVDVVGRLLLHRHVVYAYMFM